MKQRVLFLCTHNANRSQIAEGLVNYFLSDRWEACSAGTAATSVNPRAIRAMAELGIDISGQRSKTSPSSTVRPSTGSSPCAARLPIPVPSLSAESGGSTWGSTTHPGRRARTRKSWTSIAGCGTR